MRDEHPQQINRIDTGGLGKVVTAANVLVAVVLIVAIYFDSNSATVAALAGVGYFSLSTALTLLTLSGTLADIIINRQEQVTVRRRDALPYRVQAEYRVADPLRIEYTEPARLPQGPSYVPAVPATDNTVKVDAANYINHLFDESGRPMPNKISPKVGQVQHREPSAEAVEYLVALGIVRRGKGNTLYFDVTTFPTHRDALNCIRTGVRHPLQAEGV